MSKNLLLAMDIIKTVSDKMQAFFGITKSELMIVCILLGGLMLGSGVQLYKSSNKERDSSSVRLYRYLDSLARAEALSYTGSASPPQDSLQTDSLISLPRKGKPLPEKAININTATLAELTLIPGVGVGMATRIVEFRKKQTFRRKADILKIHGVGEKKFEKMKPYITVE